MKVTQRLAEDFGVQAAGVLDLVELCQRLGYPKPGMVGMSLLFGAREAEVEKKRSVRGRSCRLFAPRRAPRQSPAPPPCARPPAR